MKRSHRAQCLRRVPCPGPVASADPGSRASGEQRGGEEMPPLGAHASSDGEREVGGRGPFRLSSEAEATGAGDRPERE